MVLMRFQRSDCCYVPVTNSFEVRIRVVLSRGNYGNHSVPLFIQILDPPITILNHANPSLSIRPGSLEIQIRPRNRLPSETSTGFAISCLICFTEVLTTRATFVPTSPLSLRNPGRPFQPHSAILSLPSSFDRYGWVAVPVMRENDVYSRPFSRISCDYSHAFGVRTAHTFPFCVKFTKYMTLLLQ